MRRGGNAWSKLRVSQYSNTNPGRRGASEFSCAKPIMAEAVEADFGVPFAGIIQARERWSQTALKSYPDGRPLDWAELFGRSAPVVLDIGCGTGRYLLSRAVAR